MPGIMNLSRDSRGNYKRDLGWERNGDGWRQHRFYLGKDRAEACIRAGRLERLWDAIERRWNRGKAGRTDPVTGEHVVCLSDDQLHRPTWCAETLALGLAIARGEESVTVDPYLDPLLAPLAPLDKDILAEWWCGFLQDFGGLGVRLVVAGAVEDDLEKGLAERVEVLDSQWQLVRTASTSKQTLHEALDAYSEWIGQTMLAPDGSGAVSTTGRLWQRQLRQIKAHAKDVPLRQFNLDVIDRLIAHWQGRPITQRGKPASPETVRDVIKRIRTLIKWLHKSPTWEWRKPEDYESGRVRIRVTPEEMAAKKNPNRVVTYTVEELGTLWEYGSPWERLLMVLALNCGFGADQVSMLQVEDVHLAGDETHGGPWIGRVRYKTGVYGEWTLWPETVAGIQWMFRRRGASKEKALLLSKTGRPICAVSKSGNRNMAIPNAWSVLTRRIKKDQETFRPLSFNKIRKTAIDLVRGLADGETAGVFACHGQVVADELLERYANKKFGRVFQAIASMRTMLEPVFGRVADPFPADMRKHNPSISLAKRKRMAALRAEGLSYQQIGELVGCCDETVRRYVGGPEG